MTVQEILNVYDGTIALHTRDCDTLYIYDWNATWESMDGVTEDYYLHSYIQGLQVTDMYVTSKGYTNTLVLIVAD